VNIGARRRRRTVTCPSARPARRRGCSAGDCGICEKKAGARDPRLRHGPASPDRNGAIGRDRRRADRVPARRAGRDQESRWCDFRSSSSRRKARRAIWGRESDGWTSRAQVCRQPARRPVQELIDEHLRRVGRHQRPEIVCNYWRRRSRWSRAAPALPSCRRWRAGVPEAPGHAARARGSGRSGTLYWIVNRARKLPAARTASTPSSGNTSPAWSSAGACCRQGGLSLDRLTG